MSLLDDFARPCVLMEKVREPDGEGGAFVTWVEGVEFQNYQALNTSMEARIAEKQGVTSVYNVLVKKDFPLEFGDAFKDRETGLVYRVTSNPEEKIAPKSSSFDLKFCTAERWSLPA